MAIPQLFGRSIRPGGAVPSNAGLAHEAAAGVGRALQQAGASVEQFAEVRKNRSDVLAVSRGWRTIDEWKLDYLRGYRDRRAELAATSIDPETGETVTGYEKELKAFPDQLNAKFEELSAGLSASARAMFAERFNLYAPKWADDAVTILDHMELEDVAGEILDLAAADRASESMELLEQYKDRLSPAAAAKLEATIAKSAAESRLGAAKSYLQDLAASDGWEAAQAALNDPGFQKTFELDLSAAGDVKTDLDKFVSTARALDERTRTLERETANNAVIADAKEGKLDLGTLWESVRAGTIDRAVALQGEEILLHPRSENDPAAYDQLQTIMDGFTRGALSQGEASSRVNAIAGGLKAATLEGARAALANTYSAQVQARQEVSSRAREQLLDAQLASEESFAMTWEAIGTDAGKAALNAERKRQLALVSQVEDELDQFLKRKPDASREEILREGRTIIALVSRDPNAPPPSVGPALGATLSLLQMIPQDSAAAETIPAGLEAIWDSLDAEGRQDAMTLLKAGRTPEDLLRMYEENR